MTVFRLEYPLVDGYVDNWLVAGPRVEAVADLERFVDAEDARLAVAEAYYRKISDVHEPPVLRGSLSGDAEYRWEYYRCQEDHLIERSATYASLHYLCSWAYAEVVAPKAQEVTVVLSTFGPADVWINGQRAHRQAQVSRDPIRAAFEVEFKTGRNEVLVRFEQVAVGDCPYSISLRVVGLPPSDYVEADRPVDRRAAFTPSIGEELLDRTSVLLPTETAYTLRHRMLERVFAQAIVERRVHFKGNTIPVRWSEDLEARTHYMGYIMDAQDRVYVEARQEAQGGETVDLGHHVARLWERAYDVVLRPRPQEWYEYNLRYEQRIPIQVLDTEYSEALYGTYEQRRAEVLEYATQRRADVYAEIAKMELGRWDEVDGERVSAALARIARREAGSAAWLLGLLGTLYRNGDASEYPAGLASEIEACCVGLSYGADASGLTGWSGVTGLGVEGEGESILADACELLAGQRFPEATFAASGQAGAWHRARAEGRAVAWLRQRALYGFNEWDSGVTFEQIVVALTHLVELAESELVQELSAVVLDKLLLSIALNSYKGAFGATQGRTGGAPVTSAQLQATAGITRLLWGMGVWNAAVMGAVSLACSEYEMPLPVADVAVNMAATAEDEMWQREHHGGAEGGVDKVTFRTGGYMLASAQDYHPGEKGGDEHIWQATLGPDAVVFVNHPATMSESGSRRPNCWAGNGVLPRVAQWKDTLIAVHKLPEGEEGTFEGRAMTHAYLPVYEFDECELVEGWCFVRKDTSYLALTAARGIELVTRGPNNHRELRSYGAQNVWLCYLGDAAAQGDFHSFQERVLALDLKWGELSARCATLRGDRLSFGWDGAFEVNGEEQPLAGFKHYEGPVCDVELGATKMEVRTANYAMTLQYGEME